MYILPPFSDSLSSLPFTLSISISISISRLPFFGVYLFLSTYKGLELWLPKIILSAGNTNSHFAIFSLQKMNRFLQEIVLKLLFFHSLYDFLPNDTNPKDVFHSDASPQDLNFDKSGNDPSIETQRTYPSH